MRKRAGDRGIEAALDAQASAGPPPKATAGRAKRRKLRQSVARTKAYLTDLRRSARAL